MSNRICASQDRASAAMPGRVRPSSHSRKAPPAVETYVNWSVTPAALSAATVSPPPATEVSLPALVRAAACARQRERALAERRDLEGAERAVPQQRLAARR